ncbi:MAG TPA: chloramphenicol phosphotransferase, partial [Ornithinimicrobium sp.]|nr:chloramphenicol phosphotransferase [Ornithinimicrobium sp.]
ERLHRAMHRSVAALARAGCDVVVDHVLLEPRCARDLAAVLDGLDVVLVGVRCPAPVLAVREQERADRTVGQALAQLRAVHAHGPYDVEVDTSVTDPGTAAVLVLDGVRRRRGHPALSGWPAGGADPA